MSPILFISQECQDTGDLSWKAISDTALAFDLEMKNFAFKGWVFK